MGRHGNSPSLCTQDPLASLINAKTLADGLRSDPAERPFAGIDHYPVLAVRRGDTQVEEVSLAGDTVYFPSLETGFLTDIVGEQLDDLPAGGDVHHPGVEIPVPL